MKNYEKTPSTKDFLYLMLLIGLIKVAIVMQDHQTPTHFANAQPDIALAHLPSSLTQPITNQLQQNEQSFIAEENTLIEPSHLFEIPPAPEKKSIVQMQPFNADEINENILKQIEMAHQHIDAVLSVIHPTSMNTAQLESLKQRLRNLRRQYQKRTPANGITLASAPQDQLLEKEILGTIHKTGAIIHEIIKDDQPYTPDSSIIKSLAINHDKITTLIAS
jgi:hypothetical protein